MHVLAATLAVAAISLSFDFFIHKTLTCAAIESL
jgi:hypothetical protein